MHSIMDDATLPQPDQSVNQDTLIVLKELTSSIKDLTKLIAQQNTDPREKRLSAKAKRADNPISSAIREQNKHGRPTQIPDWKKIEFMSDEEIEEEDQHRLQRYHDFWKEYNFTPSPSEWNATEDAYKYAFERFDEINHSLGWKTEHGRNLRLNTVNLHEYRQLLIESIFGLELYRQDYPSEISQAAFEYSRLPRLLTILIRVQSIENTNPAKEQFDARTVLKVLIEVARTIHFTSWIDNLNTMTLDDLVNRCYSRQILEQPGPDEFRKQCQQFDTLFTCLSALDFTTELREIRPPLSGVFYLRYKSEPIHKIFDILKARREQVVAIGPFKQLALEESNSLTFSPEQFNIQSLQQLGGLNIEWTSCLDQHLKIYTGRNAIRIFAHPTFFYNGIDLHRQERDYVEPTYMELFKTYALLFRPSSRRHLKKLQQFTTAGRSDGLPWHECVTFLNKPIRRWSRRNPPKESAPNKKLDFNPSRSPAKGILENFFRCSLPPSIQATYNISNPSNSIKDIASLEQNKITNTSMQDICRLAPHYPEDIAFMITSVFEIEFKNKESFQGFAYFGPRLRELKTYMDSQKPETFLQLWRDGRDSGSWWTFWAVLFFGVFTILLTFIGLALQAIQIAQAYQS